MLTFASIDPKCRRGCRARGMRDRPARKGIPGWVVERAFAWLNQQRRLQIRLDRTAAHDLGFLDLACALPCLNYIRGS